MNLEFKLVKNVTPYWQNQIKNFKIHQSYETLETDLRFNLLKIVFLNHAPVPVLARKDALQF